MKFKEALYEVLDNVMPVEDGKENVVSPETVKLLSFFWNMLAVSSKDGKIMLDDLVNVDKMNKINSIPIPGKESTANKKTAIEKETGAVKNESKEPKTKPAKKSKPKSETK